MIPAFLNDNFWEIWWVDAGIEPATRVYVFIF